MIGKTVTQLLCDLHITASLSRPHVSNDNPYSEAWNKTLKYAPVFPDDFASLIDARTFLARVRALLQPRAPPFRDRTAHPGQRPRRHLAHDPRTPPTNPRPCLPRSPRAVPQASPCRAHTPQGGLDQPTDHHHRNPHSQNRLTVSPRLTSSAQRARHARPSRRTSIGAPATVHTSTRSDRWPSPRRSTRSEQLRLRLREEGHGYAGDRGPVVRGWQEVAEGRSAGRPGTCQFRFRSRHVSPTVVSPVPGIRCSMSIWGSWPPGLDATRCWLRRSI